MLAQRTSPAPDLRAPAGAVGPPTPSRLPASSLLAPRLPGCVLHARCARSRTTTGHTPRPSPARWSWSNPTSSLCGRRRRHAEPRKEWTEAARREFPRRRAPDARVAAASRCKHDFYLPKDAGPENPLRPAAAAEPGGVDQHPQLRPRRRRCATSTASSTGPSARAWPRCAKPPARTTRCSPTSATATPAAGARRCA